MRIDLNKLFPDGRVLLPPASIADGTARIILQEVVDAVIQRLLNEKPEIILALIDRDLNNHGRLEASRDEVFDFIADHCVAEVGSDPHPILATCLVYEMRSRLRLLLVASKGVANLPRSFDSALAPPFVISAKELRDFCLLAQTARDQYVQFDPVILDLPFEMFLPLAARLEALVAQYPDGGTIQISRSDISCLSHVMLALMAHYDYVFPQGGPISPEELDLLEEKLASLPLTEEELAKWGSWRSGEDSSAS